MSTARTSSLAGTQKWLQHPRVDTMDQGDPLVFCDIADSVYTLTRGGGRGQREQPVPPLER
ncbi:hypothetical protein OHB12_07940 [Nocardia sp. NBC_01730]|uniref:hypothetical protein n=1 Tax=Nocardia sp. NBC_01730 TaxID=2975998 RepID=UPI002E13776E|nr:hypothetical protein OHB12_07940 [Nocardia sp. NBC_01730]